MFAEYIRPRRAVAASSSLKAVSKWRIVASSAPDFKILLIRATRFIAASGGLGRIAQGIPRLRVFRRQLRHSFQTQECALGLAVLPEVFSQARSTR